MIIEIDTEDYIDMLYEKYKNVPDNWKNDKTDGLIDDLMELIRNCPPNPKYAKPDYIIDNFCINGDFRNREDYDDKEWEELDALLKNDKYACIQF